jgi:hypothetical protein
MSSYLVRGLSRLRLRDDSVVEAPITEPVVPLPGIRPFPEQRLGTSTHMEELYYQR